MSRSYLSSTRNNLSQSRVVAERTSPLFALSGQLEQEEADYWKMGTGRQPTGHRETVESRDQRISCKQPCLGRFGKRRTTRAKRGDDRRKRANRDSETSKWSPRARVENLLFYTKVNRKKGAGRQKNEFPNRHPEIICIQEQRDEPSTGGTARGGRWSRLTLAGRIRTAMPLPVVNHLEFVY